MTSRSFLIGLTIASAFALAACSGSDVKGTPTSAPETTASSAETTSSAPSADLATMDPCSLLTKAEQTQLNVTREPQRDKLGTSDACALRPTGYSLIIGARASLGLAQAGASGGVVTDVTVNGRKAKQVSEKNRCLIALEVTSSSRVDVQAGSSDKDDLCPQATKAAEMVEPKLPK